MLPFLLDLGFKSNYHFKQPLSLMKRLVNFYRESYTGLPTEIWHLSWVMLINRAGAMVLPFLSLYVTSILGFTLAQSGIVLSFYGIGSLIGTYIGGQLTDKVGHYYVQLWSLILSGFSFFVLMQLTGFYELCAGLLITSAFTDALRPANMSSVAEYSPPELRTRSIGLIRLAINLGFSAGPAIGGLIAFFFGYKWLFFVDGLTCLFAALLFFTLIPRSTDHVETVEMTSPDQTHHVSPYRDTSYIIFIILVTLTGMVFMQYFHTVPVYFKEEMSLNEKYIGGLMAVNGLLIVLIEIPLIHYIENKYHHFALLVLGVTLIGFGFAAFNCGYEAIYAWISILFLTIGEILNFPFATTLVLNRSPMKGRGRYMALYNMSWSLCAIFAPIIGFAVADKFSFNDLWFGACALCLLIGIALLYLAPHFNVQKEN